METWSNQEEFSRCFGAGLFDGFWWAYVTMTTVGYGDKATKSTSGKLFAVLWVLIGITIFSMLTASLTNTITASTSVTSAGMVGKKVGVLKGRLYDAQLITASGGILDEVSSENFFEVSW